MSNETYGRILQIVVNNVREVLDKYLADKLAKDIEIEIRSGVEWDLGNMEEN